MSHSSTISAFQRVLRKFVFQTPTSWSENFAQQRFHKKYQEPSDNHPEVLHEACFNDWIEGDVTLPKVVLPLKEWYKTREFLYENIRTPTFRDIGFPQGSEFTPTHGKNSLEAKLLLSDWTCTKDNFERFALICYSHKGLRRATRRRYTNWYKRSDFDISISKADKLLFQRFSKEYSDYPFRIFSWKLERIVTFVEGSRFSSVPKNNEKRRPINIEPFANTVVQRTIGNFIRAELSRIFNIDLDNLAELQRRRIRDVDDIATIDLRNASDRISLDLCKMLLPPWLLNPILAARSEFVLGADGEYHLIKKVSSMGNGFTFELMTLILTCVARQLDPKATVFGDDIIIARDQASRLVELLENVGLQVNLDKSFSEGPFRESCGANYHVDEGYIESYDFKYPESIGDCCIFYNKVFRLSLKYPSFRALYQTLTRTLPEFLHGGPSYELEHSNVLSLIGQDFVDLLPVRFPQFFVTPVAKSKKELPVKLKKILSDYQLDAKAFQLVPGFEFKSKLRTPTLRHLPSHFWSKYEMYIDSGRRAKDVLTNEGEWVTVWYVTSGERHLRAATLSNI